MKQKKNQHFGLILMFVLVLFLTLVIHTVLVGILMYFLESNTSFSITGITPMDIIRLTSILALASIPTGMLLATLVSKFPLKPIRALIDGMDTLASGDFSSRINVGTIMRKYPSYVGVASSFNKMAEQLESTEMLRNDFVNNFSHEFKTPIVSIAGFAKLLKRGDLTEEQKQEYLTAIEEESIRLSVMATNVLNLTKVENQTILSDVKEFNLSEQIRSCILLMERKWAEKGLELNLEFEEYTICGNEELLKQVWINLLDNAIKFAPHGHTIRIDIHHEGDSLRVDIMNTGSSIPPEKQKLIFNKFYQAEESHTTAGNGVGLAIVKRVVGLHNGSVRVSSNEEITTFSVILPQK